MMLPKLVARSFFCFLLPLLLGALPLPVGASSVEVSGSAATGQIVVSESIATGQALHKGVYWNATGIKVGNKLHLYVQGNSGFGGNDIIDIPDENCLADGDKILLFEAPWTVSGVTGPFNFVKRIHPCTVNDPNQLSFWGPGQVFQDVAGRYRMVAELSDGANFPEWRLGTSSDGVNWTWQDFVTTDPNELRIMTPILVGDPTVTTNCSFGFCWSTETWWGFFPFDDLDQFATPRTGTGRMRVLVASIYQRGFRVEILDENGSWRAVDDSSGFFNFKPKNVWPAVSVRSLILDDGKYELWAWRNVTPPSVQCTSCSDPLGDTQGTTFRLREVTQSTMGSVQSVFSQIRCMPSTYDVARTFPLRINGPNGMKLLYSATNDQNICRDDLFESWTGEYMVVTEVSN